MRARVAAGQTGVDQRSARFGGVRVIGIDEHVWRHTGTGDKYVTVIIDLTAIRDGTGPSRLLDMVEGRSKAAFKTWLDEREQAWREAVEVVAMDGFTGFKTATAEELPDAVAVMDPFHVVRLAGDALDRCRRRVHQDLHGHRGRAKDPLYRASRTLHTGADLLTDKQQAQLDTLFANEDHVQVEATWGTKRAVDVPAYFDRPGTSNGPTEAINGRLEHLRGSALGFRNLTNYIARSLLETGGFRPQLHPRLG
jgi:transposase